MAASARIFTSLTSLPSLKTTRFHFPRQHLPSLSPPVAILPSQSHSHSQSFPKSPCNPLFRSFPASTSAQFSVNANCFDRVFFGAKDDSFCWNFASRPISNDRNGRIFDDGNRPEVAVVVLGWLGAKPNHLRRYVEMYNNRGVHAVTFVASVMDVLWVDFGRSLEERIERLSQELAEWLSDGRDRFLMFHTFSNTGWLAYGAILDHLKDRKDLMNRIKGCVVDSGGDPKLDPKVWAAGFTTALLKKNSSATYPSIGVSTGNHSGIVPNGSKVDIKETFFLEALMLSMFEKFFSLLLNLPYVKQKLTKIIDCLSEKQPPCPQLYLYSSGDRVIPYQSIESFIDEQRRTGKEVTSFNFGGSPHVDHYRTFPEVYMSEVDSFLNKCLSSAGMHV